MSHINAENGGAGLLACHECDSLHRVAPVPPGGRAACARCGAGLYQHVSNPLDRLIALILADLILFAAAHGFPFLSMKLGGRVEENVLISSSVALFEHSFA